MSRRKSVIIIPDQRFVFDQQHTPALGATASEPLTRACRSSAAFATALFAAVAASPIEIAMSNASPAGRQSNVAVPLSCCWMLAVMTLVP